MEKKKQQKKIGNKSQEFYACNYNKPVTFVYV